jgi:hypothetical protein
MARQLSTDDPVVHVEGEAIVEDHELIYDDDRVPAQDLCHPQGRWPVETHPPTRRGSSGRCSRPSRAGFDDLHPGLLPKSALRRATTYAINQREFFLLEIRVDVRR